MATTVREYSLDFYLLERMRFSGVEKENLTDIVGIVASLKNKYGIVPFDVTPHGLPVPNCLTVRYLIESIALNKVMNVLLDTPRLQMVSILPRGIPRSTQFEVHVTLGG
jgi:hypothetical protein